MVKWRVEVWKEYMVIKEVLFDDEQEARQQLAAFQKTYDDDFDVTIESFNPKYASVSSDDKITFAYVLLEIVNPLNWFT